VIRYAVILFLICTSAKTATSFKNNIIQNLKNINNVTFNFEQNINNKIESGICIIQYPQKIFCKYDLDNQKVLVSNGKSLVIKTLTSFYLYPLDKTPLNYILDKDFLINKIPNLDERVINDKLVNYKFLENENEINVFFDKDNYNLVGWQTLDIYQNLTITHLNSIKKNQEIEEKLFQLPNRN
jgi:outer membrane lipoprotein-sorting protein